MANEYHQTADIPIIGYDEREAAYKAVDYLIQSGRTSIGFCFDTESSEAQNKESKAILMRFLITVCRLKKIGCLARLLPLRTAFV